VARPGPKECGIITDTQGEVAPGRIPHRVNSAGDDAVQDGIFAMAIVLHQLCQHSSALL
jgi:hypothetical protein